MASVPFPLRTIGHNLLTRDQGASARRLLEAAVAALAEGDRLLVDFDGVEAITPSFADECLGRLLLNLGVSRFRERVRLRTEDETVRRLVNRVLAYRAKQASAAA